MERKHNIIALFLLFWFSPDLINNLTSLEVNEFIIDSSLRICVALLIYELYASINFSRIYLKGVAFILLVATIYEIFSYIIISMLLDNPFLNNFMLVLRLVSFCFAMIGITQLTLSYHYEGERITRKNIYKRVRQLWRP